MSIRERLTSDQAAPRRYPARAEAVASIPYWTPRLTHYLTHHGIDVGRKWWTLVDGFIRGIIQRRPPLSIDFRLPLVRNQQVIGSSPIDGSKIHFYLVRYNVSRDAFRRVSRARAEAAQSEEAKA